MRRTGGRLGGVAAWVWLGTLCLFLLVYPACDNAPDGPDSGNAVRVAPTHSASAIIVDATRESVPLATPILISKLQAATETPLGASPAGVAVVPTVAPTVTQVTSVLEIVTATPLLTQSPAQSPEPTSPTVTLSIVSNVTAIPVGSPTAEITGAARATVSQTATPTRSTSPTAPSATPAATATETEPTPTATASHTSIPTVIASATHPPTAMPSPAPTPTPLSTILSTITPTQRPTATAIPTSTHTPVPENCRIKGNINMETGERVYHTPDSPWYARTEIDTGSGERWFCTEREALDAGWRAPGRSQATPVASDATRSAPGECEAVVNINTAGAEELELLPGIGKVLAQRIVEFRRMNGPFSSVDELDEVERIGPATVERIRECVRLG